MSFFILKGPQNISFKKNFFDDHQLSIIFFTKYGAITTNSAVQLFHAQFRSYIVQKTLEVLISLHDILPVMHIKQSLLIEGEAF